MAKITLTDLTSLANDTSAVNSINVNFQAIEDYINDNVFSRDAEGETNTMQNDIDLNSYDLSNVGAANITTLTLGGVATTTALYEDDVARLSEANDYSATQRANTQEVAGGTSLTPDMGVYNNFVITLDDDITIANPSNEAIGQTGFIAFVQDGTGSHTVSFGSEYLTVAGATPSPQSDANAISLYGYVVIGAGQVLLGDGLLNFTATS